MCGTLSEKRRDGKKKEKSTQVESGKQIRIGGLEGGIDILVGDLIPSGDYGDERVPLIITCVLLGASTRIHSITI